MAGGDFCSAILVRYGKSDKRHHQNECEIIGSISQHLKDHKKSSSDVNYFGAIISFLDAPKLSTQTLDALLGILFRILPRLSLVFVMRNFKDVEKRVVRILRERGVSEVGVSAGIKCVGHLLGRIGNVCSWIDLASSYGVLISYVTDNRDEVRRKSHALLYDVLTSFQGTTILAPASEAIENIFERFLLLFGGSNTSPSKGPNGIQEVLYILDAFKVCLPLIFLKSSTNILKHYKFLLKLHQPPVIGRITDGLYLLCSEQQGEVSAEMLLDLLGLFANSISQTKIYGDSMIYNDSMSRTVHLLDAGMKKVYLINRQICVDELPVVFRALAGLLASERLKLLAVSTKVFLSLIASCIDERLIKEGTEIGSGRSAPITITEVCATIESLLEDRYAVARGCSLLIVSAMFNKLGDSSYYLLSGTLPKLADMQKLCNEVFPFREQLHDCVGSAVVAMGPENFLSLMPLNLEAEDVSQVNVWLFPILERYIVGSSLNFFTKSIFDMIGRMKKYAELEQGVNSARNVDGLTSSLWSLLPSFCNYPSDTAESFEDLEKVLCSSLCDDANFCGIICSSLTVLIQQNKKILEGNGDKLRIGTSKGMERALAHYTPEVAAKNLKALKLSARRIYPALVEIFLKTFKDDGRLLKATIHEIASISDRAVVSRWYKNVMKELSDNSSDKRAQWLDLAASLLPLLGSGESDSLFVAVESSLKDSDEMIQKKAYEVLSVILKTSDGFISRKLEDVLKMMEVPCHFGAKRTRLDCLYLLFEYVTKDKLEARTHVAITSFLKEIIHADM